jgi:hypothetical protein
METFIVTKEITTTLRYTVLSDSMENAVAVVREGNAAPIEIRDETRVRAANMPQSFREVDNSPRRMADALLQMQCGAVLEGAGSARA